MPTSGIWQDATDHKYYPASYTYYFRETKLEDSTGKDITNLWFRAYKDEEDSATYAISRTNLFNYRKSDLTIVKKWNAKEGMADTIKELYFTVTDDKENDVGNLICDNPGQYGLTANDVSAITVGSKTYYTVKMIPEGKNQTWTGNEKLIIDGLMSSKNSTFVQGGQTGENGRIREDAWPEVRYKIEEVAYKDAATNEVKPISELCIPSYQFQIRNYGNGAWQDHGTMAPSVQLGFIGDTKVRLTNTLAFDVTIKKTNADGTIGLANAHFALYNDSDVINDTVKENAIPISINNNPDLVSGADGTISLGMLDKGTYYLVETQSPAGYIALTKPVKIDVNPSSTVTKQQDGKSYPLYVQYTLDSVLSSSYEGIIVKEEKEGNVVKTYKYTLIVPNTSGVTLPSTGGPGTNRIYLLGIMLISLAGAGLTMRKRKKNTI